MNNDIFQQQLNQARLANEKLRSTALITFFSIGFTSTLAIRLLNPTFFPDIFWQPVQGMPFLNWLMSAMLSIIIYEAVAKALIWQVGHHYPQWLRTLQFFNAIEEITIPTLFMIGFSYVFIPIYAILLPPVFLYFLFLSIGALRLDFKLSCFTAVLAASEYAFLAIWLIQKGETDGILAAPIHHLFKIVILLGTGIITAVVAQRIKQQVIHSLESVAERDHIATMFGQHVSPQVVDKLLSQKSELTSETREVCVMFLDIRNFTTFSENKDPEEVVAFLNVLFGSMIEIINQHNGIINKFLGDGFMAVFGAPFSNGNDSLNAVNAAREILERVAADSAAGRIPPTRVGIGLHTGLAVTGHVGSAQRKEYTLIGDVVNLASRIESLNKEYNSQLLLSETVQQAIGAAGATAIDLGLAHVKGRGQAVRIYQAG
jgi:adenylate cyclase